MRLAVDLYDTRVGTLEGDARTFDFRPDVNGSETFGVNSTALSVAIPLSPRLRRDQAGRRRAWFHGLLPEGDQYDFMLTQAGLRRGDVPGFLARFGRDSAGALQIWDLDNPNEPLSPDLRPVTDEGIRLLLENPLRTPLGNDPSLGKSSLGGVQPKVVLVRTADGWGQALGGYPTSHILKPRLPGEHSSVIFDEEYGSRLMRLIGLSEHATWIDDFHGLEALVVERFDRQSGRRIHQEDFSQALGAEGNQKYQEIGGVVSLRRVADVLRRHGALGDRARLARMTVAAVALGNLDMHTKNLGLLHPQGSDLSLAPAYDVVPQAHQAGDGRMALAVNGQYPHADITAEDLEAEFGSWGLRDADVSGTIAQLSAAVASETPLPGAFPGLQEQMAGFIENLSAGKPAGR